MLGGGYMGLQSSQFCKFKTILKSKVYGKSKKPFQGSSSIPKK